MIQQLSDIRSQIMSQAADITANSESILSSLETLPAVLAEVKASAEKLSGE
jgi:hypothetical protein